jgi:hypothetical protein
MTTRDAHNVLEAEAPDMQNVLEARRPRNFLVPEVGDGIFNPAHLQHFVLTQPLHVLLFTQGWSAVRMSCEL